MVKFKGIDRKFYGDSIYTVSVTNFLVNKQIGFKKNKKIKKQYKIRFINYHRYIINYDNELLTMVYKVTTSNADN